VTTQYASNLLQTIRTEVKEIDTEDYWPEHLLEALEAWDLLDRHLSQGGDPPSEWAGPQTEPKKADIRGKTP
jgi:hypothetical protein